MLNICLLLCRAGHALNWAVEKESGCIHTVLRSI